MTGHDEGVDECFVLSAEAVGERTEIVVALRPARRTRQVSAPRGWDGPELAAWCREQTSR